MGRLPIAASLAPGVPTSLYFRAMTERDLESNVRDTERWPDVQDDPMFVNIPEDGETVAIEDLINRRDEMRELEDEDQGDVEDAEIASYMDASDRGDFDNEPPGSQKSIRSPGSPHSRRSSSIKSRVSYRSSLSQGSPRSVEGRVSEERQMIDNGETEEERCAREQEERLAALGVAPRNDERSDTLFTKRSPHNGMMHGMSDHHKKQHAPQSNGHREHGRGRDRRESHKRPHPDDLSPYPERRDRRNTSWDRPPPPPPHRPHTFHDILVHTMVRMMLFLRSHLLLMKLTA